MAFRALIRVHRWHDISREGYDPDEYAQLLEELPFELSGWPVLF